MHELSVAISIVESVEAAVASRHDGRITAVHVRVGSMSGVIPEALRFAWGPATSGTTLADATLEIEEVPASIFCQTCDQERETAGMRMVCPVCGNVSPRLTRGRELELLSVELDV